VVVPPADRGCNAADGSRGCAVSHSRARAGLRRVAGDGPRTSPRRQASVLPRSSHLVSNSAFNLSNQPWVTAETLYTWVPERCWCRRRSYRWRIGGSMRLTRVRGGVAVNLLSAGWCLWPRNERRQRSNGPVVDGGPARLKRVSTSANISSKLCEHRLVHRPCRCGGRRYSCPTPPAGVLKPSESVLMKRLRQPSAHPHLARIGRLRDPPDPAGSNRVRERAASCGDSAGGTDAQSLADRHRRGPGRRAR